MEVWKGIQQQCLVCSIPALLIADAIPFLFSLCQVSAKALNWWQSPTPTASQSSSPLLQVHSWPMVLNPKALRLSCRKRKAHLKGWKGLRGKVELCHLTQISYSPHPQIGCGQSFHPQPSHIFQVKLGKMKFSFWFKQKSPGESHKWLSEAAWHVECTGACCSPC